MATIIGQLKKSFGVHDRPPKVTTKWGSGTMMGAPALMVAMSFVALMVAPGFISEVYVESLEGGKFLAVLAAVGVGLLVGVAIALSAWSAILFIRQIDHWGYWEVIHEHTLKLKREWEAENGR